MALGYGSEPEPTGQIVLKWDPKNLEIRTRTVELTLEPLVMQVTLEDIILSYSLVNCLNVHY